MFSFNIFCLFLYLSVCLFILQSTKFFPSNLYHLLWLVILHDAVNQLLWRKCISLQDESDISEWDMLVIKSLILYMHDDFSLKCAWICWRSITGIKSMRAFITIFLQSFFYCEGNISPLPLLNRNCWIDMPTCFSPLPPAPPPKHL